MIEIAKLQTDLLYGINTMEYADKQSQTTPGE